ncbi:LppY/LpqO family protein [Methanosarcina sp. UBA5]|uniref:LppY/LpqO family protein n=1 Tax=Methanosarcina sp. UBA5 TaxID=1915593 RepID=UPI0025D6EDF5|nr:LppY/LpqO family protein [Methanosarcina sp. UBA5]
MSKKTIKLATAFIALLLCVAIVGEISAKAPHTETVNSSDDKNVSDSYWASTEKTMGVKSELKPNDAITFSIPMGEKVTLDGIPLNTASDRTHDFDFMRVGNKTMMVGEIGLTETEVKNVTKMVLQSGFQITALHNHLLRLSPHILWMHIHGYGDSTDMAKKIRSITDYVNGKPPAKSEESFLNEGINTTKLDKIFGEKGSTEGGDYGFDIPRADKIRMNGYVLSPAMDVSTLIHFQPIGNSNAAVIGELVLEENEVEPVMQTLSNKGIEITALHSHMITEQPRLFYLHCWATGNATEIASIMREALNETNSTIGS